MISILVSTQKLSAQNRKLQKALERYEYGFYNEAIGILKEVVRDDKNAYTPLKYLASSYRKVKDYQNAELYYTLLVNSDSAQAEDFLYYGQALKSNGKLAAAKEQFVKFKESTESSFLSKLMLQSIDQINAWENQPKSYRSISMEGLNTDHNEYGAIVFKDKLYITSDREASLTTSETFSWNDKPFLSVYEMDTANIENGPYEFEEVSGSMNTVYHDGPLTIDELGNRAMITRVDNQMGGKNFVNRMKLFEGTYKDGKWKSFKAFPFNSNKYSVGHAHYADSGRTVYFASDMPGGFGGMDLYVCYREDDGRWTMPENLGAVINTSKNEVFPFMMGDELYFSSNGFPGYGELDILVSIRNADGWGAPQNLKSPINSNRDDFGIFFDTDTSGYYASNREGGKGLDDIFRFIKYGDNIEITGVFEFEGLPVQGTKVKLVNANDSVIAETYTDADGNFIFKNLTYQESYMIQIESDDPDIVEDGRVYLTDEEGDKIKFIERMKKGGFQFMALPKDEIKEVAAIKAADDLSLDELKFVGQVFETLPGDIDEEVTVYLLDAQGEVIDSTVTDESGNFEFNRLPHNENYLIQVKETDSDMNIAFMNESDRVYNIEKMNADGVITIEPTLDASQLVEQAKNRGFTTLIARLENKGAPVTNTIIEIYDTDNNLVSTVITNDKGEFQYNMLEYDKHYFIRIPEMDDDMLDNSLLYVVKSDGTPLYLINLLANGDFEFESLPYDEYDDIQENEKRLVPDEVSLAGQLLPTEDTEIVEGLEVYLIGEDGRVVDTVRTDASGRFEFTKLNPEENYTFQLSGTESPVTLALIDEANKVVETAVMNDDGTFRYTKLTYQVAQFVPMSTEEADLIEETYSHEVTAQVFKKLPGDMGAGVKIFLYDEGGELIKTAITDEHGNFTFEKLTEDQNYIIRIATDEENFTMVTYNEDNEVVETKIRKQGVEFAYSPLGFIEHSIDEAQTEEEELVAYTGEGAEELDKDLEELEQQQEIDRAVKSESVAYRGEINADGKFTLFYDYDKSNLGAKAREKLNHFVMLFAEDEFLIEISSHTDQRGPDAYNMELSRQRTESVSNYLREQGIDPSRIRGKWYGESRPLVDCDKENCTHKEHQLNRRSEIQPK